MIKMHLSYLLLWIRIKHVTVIGCLWAMNPSKVGKMDEEVQKWSRKDPQAIKKAMIYPGK